MQVIYHKKKSLNPETGGERFHNEVLSHLEKIGMKISFLEPKACHKPSFLYYLMENLRLLIEYRKVFDNDKKNIIILDYTNRLTHFFLNLIIRINRKAVSIVNVRAIYFSYRRNVLKNMIDLCITRSFLSNSDIIVTAGERLKEIIIRNWKVRRKQIKVIPSAVREEFRNNTCKAGLPKEENWNLIYVGRMHPIKGLEYLLDALRILIDYPITLHIVAALDGTRYCKKILRKIEDDRLISRIKLHGRVCDINRLIRLYLSSHISVLSSLWDTYPTALVESMCVGLPVVATTVGDIPYIVENGRTGILVSPKDHIRMAHAIRYLVEHRDVWVSMSERSFERSKIFRQRGWEDVADEFNQAIFRKDSVN